MLVYALRDSLDWTVVKQETLADLDCVDQDDAQIQLTDSNVYVQLVMSVTGNIFGILKHLIYIY